MPKPEPKNHLNDNFYTTPKFASQVMTYRQWQETALATQGKIISCGETQILHAKHMGGGMYIITATPNYWTDNKPQKIKSKGS
jgi:hypothetical protein